ncbi:hypothetical protein ACTG16_23090 [Aeromonas sp. 23P]|uniref:hypothetical protein n=1 Tax=Aeromonas sp. 23P TaxID=3452716 RepID=UPI003F7912D3|nr:hypothetical protein [Aeromonas veronii]
MSPDYFALAAILFAVIGLGASEYHKAQERKRVSNDTHNAIDSLRKKGFDVTLDRLDGFDVETQREMELVRAVGYTVTQSGKPIKLTEK